MGSRVKIRPITIKAATLYITLLEVSRLEGVRYAFPLARSIQSKYRFASHPKSRCCLGSSQGGYMRAG